MSTKRRNLILFGAGVLVLLAVSVSPFASSRPDGLERVADDQGFLHTTEGKTVWNHSTLSDYQLPGTETGASTVVAGALGSFAAFGVAWGIGRLVQNRRREEK